MKERHLLDTFLHGVTCTHPIEPERVGRYVRKTTRRRDEGKRARACGLEGWKVGSRRGTEGNVRVSVRAWVQGVGGGDEGALGEGKGGS